jgi:hypothetical protein
VPKAAPTAKPVAPPQPDPGTRAIWLVAVVVVGVAVAVMGYWWKLRGG